MSCPWPEAGAVLAGPVRSGSELIFHVEDDRGRGAVVAQLLPELSRDEALRRRWVRDVRRLEALALFSVAPVLAVGPEPNPERPGRPAPWRVRPAYDEETVQAWLQRRAPAPAEEVALLGTRIATALEPLHAHGVVLVDLDPKRMVQLPDRICFVDVALRRVDVLSTRTAQSILLEASSFAAPEALRRTVLDPRADLFGLGVVLFLALTGTVPFDRHAVLLGELGPTPSLSKLRSDVPPPLAELIERCLSPAPEDRPKSARLVADILRGGRALANVKQPVTCHGCGATMRSGQRLCLSCGNEAVQFFAAARHDPTRRALVLASVREDAELVRTIREALGSVTDRPLPPLEFLVGREATYSEEERLKRIKTPVCLFDRLTADSAARMEARFLELGLDVFTVDDERVRSNGWVHPLAWIAFVLMLLAPLALVPFPGNAWLGVFFLSCAGGILGGPPFARWLRTRYPREKDLGFLQLALREAPAALPASDPLVRRLVARVREGVPDDVRPRLEEIALGIQRLVAHRAGQPGAEAELAMVTAPLDELVSLTERLVDSLAEIDEELARLDEGDLVRRLSRTKAQTEPSEEPRVILDMLDRLRALEDRRAMIAAHLLDATDLVERAVELGLSVRGEDPIDRPEVELALQTLREADG